MEFLGVNVNVKNRPEYDNEFIPLGAFIDGYLKKAKKPITFAVARPDGTTSTFDTFIHGTPGMWDADIFFASRIVKLLLWTRGGVEVIVSGDEAVAGHIKNEYGENGARSFDAKFMSRVYKKNFTVRDVPIEEKPVSKERPVSIGANFNGCRIGFDAGGSDRKVTALIDGEIVYSEETVWYPKQNADPEYHYSGIVEAFKTAASKMPRVDAIGVSSAGIYFDNCPVIASLFIKVPPEIFEEKVKNIYIKAAKEIGDVPIVVSNDGDVTALAGAMEIGTGRVLGVAMGTSQAGGYIDAEMRVTGWLNELAFVPVDCNPEAMEDEWSGDIGCGVKYFSQDGVIKLAAAAGIELDEGLSHAQKLDVVQDLVDSGDEKAAGVFRSIGVYIAHSANLYAKFYDIGCIMLLGRVTTASCGDLIINTARKVIEEEYPALSQAVKLALPDKNNRRAGQAIAAAGLPTVNR